MLDCFLTLALSLSLQTRASLWEHVPQTVECVHIHSLAFWDRTYLKESNCLGLMWSMKNKLNIYDHDTRKVIFQNYSVLNKEAEIAPWALLIRWQLFKNMMLTLSSRHYLWLYTTDQDGAVEWFEDIVCLTILAKYHILSLLYLICLLLWWISCGKKRLLSAPVQDIFSLCIIHWQKDSLLVCEAHQAAEVDTLLGSSSPRFWIPGMRWCGDMRAAGSHLESVTWEHGENVSEVGSVQ